jgi:hypothetical protein
VNRALLDATYPPGQLYRNGGDVIFDSPNRATPYAHQATVGYVRELMRTLAAHVDYVHSENKDMFLARNLYPMQRANTTRTGAITRIDSFGVLGADATNYKQHVWVMENTGESKYDALNLSLEKRYSSNWSGRVSYSLSKSRGTAEDQADKNYYQVLSDLKLDSWSGPSSVDRTHILSIGARAEIPKTKGANVSTTLRYMSGRPFTRIDSSIDVDQNGELQDPVPAGTYSGTAPDSMQNVDFDGGRNGARGPNYFQTDVRAGWHHEMSGRTLELFLDIYNITNHANFENPTVSGVPGSATDRRTPATFLVLTNLYGGGGFPRQAQVGIRYAF